MPNIKHGDLGATKILPNISSYNSYSFPRLEHSLFDLSVNIDLLLREFLIYKKKEKESTILFRYSNCRKISYLLVITVEIILKFDGLVLAKHSFQTHKTRF